MQAESMCKVRVLEGRLVEGAFARARPSDGRPDADLGRQADSPQFGAGLAEEGLLDFACGTVVCVAGNALVHRNRGCPNGVCSCACWGGWWCLGVKHFRRLRVPLPPSPRRRSYERNSPNCLSCRNKTQHAHVVWSCCLFRIVCVFSANALSAGSSYALAVCAVFVSRHLSHRRIIVSSSLQKLRFPAGVGQAPTTTPPLTPIRYAGMRLMGTHVSDLHGLLGLSREPGPGQWAASSPVLESGPDESLISEFLFQRIILLAWSWFVPA